MYCLFHLLRSWSASGIGSPVSSLTRAARRASVSSINESSPAVSASSGSDARSIRVSRIASADRSALTEA